MLNVELWLPWAFWRGDKFDWFEVEFELKFAVRSELKSGLKIREKIARWAKVKFRKFCSGFLLQFLVKTDSDLPPSLIIFFSRVLEDLRF